MKTKIMEKIVELSDNKWIQERWKPCFGDIVSFKRISFEILKKCGISPFDQAYFKHNITLVKGIHSITHGIILTCHIAFEKQPHRDNIEEIYVKNKNDLIWIPVGFNPETGNWQIDDLLIEILKCGKLVYRLNTWCKEKFSKLEHSSDEFLNCLNFEIQKQEYYGFINQSEIILKLIWLNELIENEKQNKD